jgi:amidase
MSSFPSTLPSARALAAALKRRELSCRELMRGLRWRASRALNPKVQRAWSRCRTPERAAGARPMPATTPSWRAASRRGRLHGFSAGGEGLREPRAGLPTSKGSPAVRQRTLAPHRQRCTVERACARAGAVVVGRRPTRPSSAWARTPTTRCSAPRATPTRTRAQRRAAAAAAPRWRWRCSMLPVADGSDMMGSLRNPAAWNHVIRSCGPRCGRVPDRARRGAVLPAAGLRRADGAARWRTWRWLLSVQAGFDGRVPLSRRMSLAGAGEAFAEPLEGEVRGTARRPGSATIWRRPGAGPRRAGARARQALRHFRRAGLRRSSRPCTDFDVRRAVERLAAAAPAAWWAARCGACMHDPALRRAAQARGALGDRAGPAAGRCRLAVHEAAVWRTNGGMPRLPRSCSSASTSCWLPAAQAFPLRRPSCTGPREVGRRARWTPTTAGWK